MKCFEKKMSEFSIIYLHDPYKCSKCYKMMKNHDDEITDDKEFMNQTKLLKGKNRQFEIADSVLDFSLEDFEIPEFPFYMPFEDYSAKQFKKVKELKKKGFSGSSSKIYDAFSGKCYGSFDYEPAKKSVSKKKTVFEENGRRNRVRKQQPYNLQRKMTDIKAPGKGTLKRKRWFFDQLNQRNDNYEDDLFEDQKFGHFQNLLADESDSSEKYEELRTPVFPFSISPRAHTPSPTYRDCYSPTELSISRKGAEEYQYRRQKRKKFIVPKDEREEVPRPNRQRRDSEVQKRLEEVARILNERRMQMERTSDSEEDQYFSDVLDSHKVNP